MNVLNRLHGSRVHPRRVRVLCRHIAELLPRNARVLDVGCGDGLLAKTLSEVRSDIRIEGLDVLVRPATHVPVRHFDGLTMPCADRSIDAILFVDVLHHADDPRALLREARRVADRAILIKDHTRNGILAEPTLRFMDWVGNARHGVRLPYQYWSRREWRQVFKELELRVEHWTSRLRLYPLPADWIFGRSLHFIARLGLKGSCHATG